MYDFLIIGGGLAGSTLAYRLINSGAKVMVMDQPQHNISSLIAAGIVNPLTGKRTALTWNAHSIFEELHQYYPMLEKEFGDSFFYPMHTYKLFDSVFEQNEWLNKKKSTGFEDFMEADICFLDHTKVNNSYGALHILQTGRLNIPMYLQTLHRYLIKKLSIKFELFNQQELSIGNSCFSYEKEKYHKVIFADGTFTYNSEQFGYLPFKNVHGEILEVEISDFYEDRIINKGIFILPQGQNKFLVGATYNWDLTKPVTTLKGKEELESKLANLIQLPYKIHKHRAGIRPSTNDRRPFLGEHPTFKHQYIFGGFGSKGVSLIPYLSKVFVEYLLNDGELPLETDICRIRPKTV